MLIQKYIGFRRNKEEEDSEKMHADMGHMVRTEEDSEVDLTSITESDTNQEIQVLSLLYHFISFKAYLLEMMEKYYTEKRSMTAEEMVVSSDIHVKKL